MSIFPIRPPIKAAHVALKTRFALPGTVAVFTMLAVLLRLTVWMSPLTRYGGHVDAQSMMWFLNWIPFALTHHLHPFSSTYINHPDGINLLWNTPMPAMAVLLWPVTTIWGAIVSYNLITTASMALSAFFGFLAIRRYVHGSVAAAAGGLVFGFSPAIIAQQGHANVAFSAVTIPLALLLLDELLVRQRLSVWLLGGLVGALGIAQFFVFEEFFATEIIAGSVVTLVLMALHRGLIRQRFRYAAGALAIGGALTAAALAYPFFGIQLGSPDQPVTMLHDPNVFSTDLLNPVLPTGSELISPGWATAISRGFSGNGSEADGYLGIPLLGVCVAALWRYRNMTVLRVVGITATILTVLSLGPHLHVAGHDTGVPLPWLLVSRLPLVRDILPSRMMFFVFLAAGILFAFVLSRLWQAKRSVMNCASLAVIVFAPLVPLVPLPASTLTVPSYFSAAATYEIPPGAVAYTIPFPTSKNVDALNWQIASRMRFKLFGGGNFLGPVSGGQGALRQVAAGFTAGASPRVISAYERQAFLAELRASNVRVVLVGPIANQSAAAAFCTSALGFPPHIADGIDIWLLSVG